MLIPLLDSELVRAFRERRCEMKSETRNLGHISRLPKTNGESLFRTSRVLKAISVSVSAYERGEYS
jgi:hypothetical protein